MGLMIEYLWILQDSPVGAGRAREDSIAWSSKLLVTEPHGIYD